MAYLPGSSMSASLPFFSFQANSFLKKTSILVKKLARLSYDTLHYDSS